MPRAKTYKSCEYKSCERSPYSRAVSSAAFPLADAARVPESVEEAHGSCPLLLQRERRAAVVMPLVPACAPSKAQLVAHFETEDEHLLLKARCKYNNDILKNKKKMPANIDAITAHMVRVSPEEHAMFVAEIERLCGGSKLCCLYFPPGLVPADRKVVAYNLQR